MSKSFTISLKIIGAFVCVGYSILLVLSIPNILLTIALGSVKFPSVYHALLILYTVFFIVALYLSWLLFNSQGDRKVIQLFFLSVGIVTVFHFGFNMWAEHENTLAEQNKQNYYKERKQFLENHCTAIDNNLPPVYRCDDGSIR